MLDRTRHTLAVALIALGGGAAGIEAYEAGRFEESLAAFRALAERQGEQASAALLHDRALAALAAGELLEAEIAAETAAAQDPAGFEWRRDAVLAASAFRRAQLAAREAEKPDAPPLAFERALEHARTALEGWRRAAVARPEWGAARRNAERALRELERLGALRDAAQERDAPQASLEPESPEPPEEASVEERPAEGPLEAQAAPDVSERAAALLELLAAKEREKRALRAERRGERSARVERDW